MSVLLLRLEGALQSWGTQSRFTIRDTGLEPSKSGVIGLLCAALGKPRTEASGDGLPLLRELAALKMGVRVDREGLMKVDYHTAGGTHGPGERYGVYKADGSLGETVLSRRYYLADACFLVGLEGDPDLLRRLDSAVAQPVWQIYLGRKSFVPSTPVRLPDTPPWGPGLREGSLRQTLESYPWSPRASRWGEPPPESLRLILESGAPTGDVRRDVPLSFEPESRRFGLRTVEVGFLRLRKSVPVVEV